MNFLRQWLPQSSSAPAGAPQFLPRPSHAVAAFFQSLSDRSHPSVLDLGRVWHSTVALLTEAGAKVYTEDLLAALADAAPPAQNREGDAVALSPRRFLEANLRYAEKSLDAILAWDVVEYLPEELLLPTRMRLHAILKPGGLLLMLFRNRPEPEGGHRYRLLTRESFAVIPKALGLRPQRVLQNRAILNLFAPFSSSRTFIGRDNLREVLFVK